MNHKLFNRNFIMVIVGQMVSIFGNAILRFALPLYILDQTGSMTIFGTILAMSTIPTILLSPFGGILADRMNRRNMMVILDSITATIIFVFSVVLSIGPVVLLVAILMMIFSVIQSFYQPVVQASIPVITSKDNLEKANGVVSLVNALSNLIGPLLAGVLYGFFGIWPILITSTICFFLAAFMEMFIKMIFVPQKKHDLVMDMIKSDFKASIHFIVKENPIMLKAMIVTSGINLFLSSMIIIGLPAMIKVKLGVSSQLYGVTQGALAAGMIVGGILISMIGKKINANNVYIFLMVSSILLIPMGLVFSLELNVMVIYWTISVCCLIMMVMTTMFNIVMMSFVQRETPNHLMGKVFSYIIAITQCTLPIGQAVYGYIFEIGMESISLIIFGTAVCSGIVSIYSRKVFKKIKTQSAQTTKEVVQN